MEDTEGTVMWCISQVLPEKQIWHKCSMYKKLQDCPMMVSYSVRWGGVQKVSAHRRLKDSAQGLKSLKCPAWAHIWRLMGMQWRLKSLCWKARGSAPEPSRWRPRGSWRLELLKRTKMRSVLPHFPSVPSRWWGALGQIFYTLRYRIPKPIKLSFKTSQVDRINQPSHQGRTLCLRSGWWLYSIDSCFSPNSNIFGFRFSVAAKENSGGASARHQNTDWHIRD